MENKKNIVLTLLSNYSYMMVSIVLGIVILPLSLNYWGTEKYGIWTLITTLGAYITLTNFGINTSITILIGKTHDKNEKIFILKRGLKIVVTLSTIFIITFYLLGLVYPNWFRFIGDIPMEFEIETKRAMTYFILFYFINLPFSLVGSALLGFYKAYLENIFAVLLLVFNTLVLILVIYKKDNLIYYTIFLGISNVVLNIIKTLFLYKVILKKENIVKNYTGETTYKEIIGVSLKSFIGGIAITITSFISMFIISNILGVSKVTPYSITNKLFTIGFSLVYAMSNSFMPIFAKEYANKNYSLIEKLYFNLKKIVIFLSGGLMLTGILLFKDIIFLWTGEVGYLGRLETTIFSVYIYFFCMNNLNSLVVNNLNYVKDTYWVYWIEMAIVVVAQITLINVCGINGVVFGLLAGTILGPFLFLKKIINNKNEIKINFNFYKEYSIVIVFFILSFIIVELNGGLVIKIIGIALYTLIYYLINKEIVLNFVKLKSRKV